MKTVPFRPRLQPLSIALGLTVGTFGAIGAAAATALLSNTAALADEPREIAPPAAIATCIDSTYVRRTEAVAQATVAGRTYYWLEGHSSFVPDAEFPYPDTELVISVDRRDRDRCRLHWDDPTGNNNALAMALPTTLARQLTLDRYRREIDRVGRDTFVSSVRNAAREVDRPSWWDEEVWALRQLNIDIPAGVKTVVPRRIPSTQLRFEQPL